MKKTILLILLLFIVPSLSVAADTWNRCDVIASLYGMSIQNKMLGHTPAQVLEYFNKKRDFDILTLLEKKNIINDAYFNPNLQGVNPGVIWNEIFNSCITPKPHYEHLK